MKLQDILYSLHVWPPSATDMDDDNIRLIANVLMKLPEDVAMQALYEIKFVCIQGPYAQFEMSYHPPHEEPLHIPNIILNFSAMEAKSNSFKETVIAHKIAHYILGHYYESDATEYDEESGGTERDKTSGGLENEKEADDLCESWGFGRGYENYDNC